MEWVLAWLNGYVEGREYEARKILLRLGRKKLGKLAAKSRAEINRIHSVERFEELAERASIVSTWKELLAE